MSTISKLAEKNIKEHLKALEIAEKREKKEMLILEQKKRKESYLSLFTNSELKTEMAELLKRADLMQLISDLTPEVLDDLIASASRQELRVKMNELLKQNKDMVLLEKALQIFEKPRQVDVLRVVRWAGGPEKFLARLKVKSFEELFRKLMEEKESSEG